MNVTAGFVIWWLVWLFVFAKTVLLFEFDKEGAVNWLVVGDVTVVAELLALEIFRLFAWVVDEVDDEDDDDVIVVFVKLLFDKIFCAFVELVVGLF